MTIRRVADIENWAARRVTISGKTTRTAARSWRRQNLRRSPGTKTKHSSSKTREATPDAGFCLRAHNKSPCRCSDLRPNRTVRYGTDGDRSTRDAAGGSPALSAVDAGAGGIKAHLQAAAEEPRSVRTSRRGYNTAQVPGHPRTMFAIIPRSTSGHVAHGSLRLLLGGAERRSSALCFYSVTCLGKTNTGSQACACRGRRPAEGHDARLARFGD